MSDKLTGGFAEVRQHMQELWDDLAHGMGMREQCTFERLEAVLEKLETEAVSHNGELAQQVEELNGKAFLLKAEVELERSRQLNVDLLS